MKPAWRTPIPAPHLSPKPTICTASVPPCSHPILCSVSTFRMCVRESVDVGEFVRERLRGAAPGF